MKDRLVQRAQTLLPSDTILTEPQDCAPFGSDWTQVPPNPGPVFLPRTTDEVATILRLCQEERRPVIPSGGRTGLAGGAVARQGEAILSLCRMNRIGEIDPLGQSVRVQAGAVTQLVHERAASAGLTWPIDLASKGTSQIGGNLATNAGGVRVIRYGMARKWVVALQAVTLSGEVLELNRDLEKNNTGYDLMQLLIGSEGTLAVITEATLRLTRLPQDVQVLLFALPSLSHLNELLERARKGPFDILALEFFSDRCLEAVEQKLGHKSRFSARHPFYVLLELEARAVTPVEPWLGELIENQVVSDGMLARSREERASVWRLREGITESLQLTAPLRKYDVSVPVRKTTAFLQDAIDTIHGFDIELYIFGHLGDGSPHLNLLKPQTSTLEKFIADCDRFEKALFPLLKSYGGSVSAEHGVGFLKKHWVRYSRTTEELRLFRLIKQAFDPDGLLNPGKVIDFI